MVHCHAATQPSLIVLLIFSQVFIAIALILGDGLYNFLKVMSLTIVALYKQYRNKVSAILIPVAKCQSPTQTFISYTDQRRTQLFLKDQIPTWFAITDYIFIAIISIIIVPHIYPHLEWYQVLVIYIFAPVLGFYNAYSCSLIDWSLVSTYGKLAIFIIVNLDPKNDNNDGDSVVYIGMKVVKTREPLRSVMISETVEFGQQTVGVRDEAHPIESGKVWGQGLDEARPIESFASDTTPNHNQQQEPTHIQ